MKTMKTMQLPNILLAAALGLPGLAAAAADDMALASDYGCLNCHHAQAHAAPTLARLSQRVARGGDQPEALRHMLAEMREADAVHTHRMVPDEAATRILRWLAQQPR